MSSKREIEEITQHIDAGLIHSTGEKIQQLFINTAKETLTSKKTKRISKDRKESKTSRKWFDNECKELQDRGPKIWKRKIRLSP